MFNKDGIKLTLLWRAYVVGMGLGRELRELSSPRVLKHEWSHPAWHMGQRPSFTSPIQTVLLLTQASALISAMEDVYSQLLP